MVNFVAFIGWAPEDTQEIFSLKQLMKKVRSMGCCIACLSCCFYCAAHPGEPFAHCFLHFVVVVATTVIVCVMHVRVFQGLHTMFMALKETGHLNTPFR
jgi:uncharacterized membrane protein YoaK (UPF0700 family)